MNAYKTVDFRLLVVYHVAQKLSFTKTALELNITQPAVTKHVREMERQLNCRLFDRRGNTISLTAQGNLFLQYAARIIRLSEEMESEIGQMNHADSGTVHIGASTTVAQTILPKLLALFKKTYPNISFTFVQGNTDFITKQILEGVVDIAIVEGAGHDPQLTYSPFVKDEIVLVTQAKSKYARMGEITLRQLTSIPLVLREQGSGTLDVLRKALSRAGISLNDLIIEIELESSVAIKQYLLHSETASFLSVQSVTNELKYNELTIIDIRNLEIYRDFQFIHQHGNVTSLSTLFMRFCKNHYNA